ncbi:DUF3300 domain-containing protein [Dyella japonica]|uniref:DUF3300 domain-containing protein n=1 Tax=Dyella japonica TaxID=231455 RepID=A0ABV2JQV7_9GAMM
MTTTRRYRFWRSWLLCAALCPIFMLGAVHAQSAPPAQGSQKIYDNQQLDQMLAPVALYPDALLSQIFMASTYPSDVADAANWSAANPKAQGDAAVKQVANQPWDPSVQSLVAFPQLMAQLKQHPDWVQNLGDAFLAQPEDVMASVQRLRAQAQKAGNLKSTEQQKVVVQQAPAGSAAPSTTYIEIQPTNPEVVYVPSYNPSVVYGTWAYPAYPPTYWPPPYGYYPVASGLAAGLAFGIGVAAINSMWGGCNWGGGNVDINVNRYNNINTNNRISGNGNTRWNHNASNRRGTPYRDSASREKFGQGVGGSQQRQQFRGRDAAGDASRQRSLESFDRATNNGSSAAARRSAGQSGAAANRPGGGGATGNRGDRGGQGMAGGNREAGAGGGANRGNIGGQGGSRQAPSARNNAFSGGQSPGNARTQSNRGQSSQRTMNSNHGRGAGSSGRQMSRPAPSRGGGGGRRRVGD